MRVQLARPFDRRSDPLDERSARDRVQIDRRGPERMIAHPQVDDVSRRVVRDHDLRERRALSPLLYFRTFRNGIARMSTSLTAIHAPYVRHVVPISRSTFVESIESNSRN